MANGRLRERSRKPLSLFCLCLLCVIGIKSVWMYSNSYTNLGRVSTLVTNHTQITETNTLQNAHPTVIARATNTYPRVSSNKTKNIYFYNPKLYHLFREWVSNTWGTNDKFKHCPVANCIVTTNKVPMDQIDAIIFKPRDMKYCPKEKLRSQVWIFAEFETPSYYFQTKCFYDLKNKVNWTMTYRRDADFHLAHGYFRVAKTPKYSNTDLDKMFLKKTKTAVVFISHCPVVSRRFNFIKKLQDHGIQVDVFGSCGSKQPKECNNAGRYTSSFNITGLAKPDCFEKVLSQYKFFLSLENSLCLDYTTEKSLHRVMRHPIVPVVRDGSNGSIFHPPHSYIHTSDFKTVKEIADYITILNNNKTAYLEYFKWKQHLYVEDIHQEWDSAFCRVCERLHAPERYRRLYGDIAAWHISPGGKPACHGPNAVI